MNNKNLGLSIGLILMVVAIVIALLLPKPKALEFFTILLASIAAVYAGFTFADGSRARDIIIEMANIGMYLVLVLLSIWETPYFLVAGYFWHGVWDAIHHEKIKLVHTRVPEWYIYGCIFFDFAIGAFILVWAI
jgi:hypothetical protein